MHFTRYRANRVTDRRAADGTHVSQESDCIRDLGRTVRSVSARRRNRALLWQAGLLPPHGNVFATVTGFNLLEVVKLHCRKIFL